MIFKGNIFDFTVQDGLTAACCPGAVSWKAHLARELLSTSGAEPSWLVSIPALPLSKAGFQSEARSRWPDRWEEEASLL